MNAPTFSIILPCYNCTPYLKDCLDSIFANELADDELILVNDGSTDEFLPFCEQYFGISVSDEPFFSYLGCRVQIITQQNQGVSASRNLGMELALKSYCLFVDPDDTVSKNWLSSLRTICTTRSDLILFGYEEFTGLDNSSRIVLPLKNYTLTSTKDCILTLLPKYIGRSLEAVQNWGKTGNFSPPMEYHSVWRMAYRREFLLTHHLTFPTDVILNEDGIFNSDCICHARKICTLMQPLYHYHIRQSGTSHTLFYGEKLVKNKCALLKERLRILEHLKQNYPFVSYDLITGATILSIFEMYLLAPKQYRVFRTDYLKVPAVLKMIQNMPYIRKASFDLPLFLLKHRCYLILHVLFYPFSILRCVLSKKYR